MTRMRSGAMTQDGAMHVNAFTVTPLAPGAIRLEVQGEWTIQEKLPSLPQINKLLGSSATTRTVKVDANGLRTWDSALPSFLLALADLCQQRGVKTNIEALPHDVRRIIELATAVPAQTDNTPKEQRPRLVARTGVWVQRQLADISLFIIFLGETIIAFGNLLRRRARYRRVDFALTVQECGAQAFPIISVISALVGMIFAFVGATQLRQFGADIYDANLVAVAMAREMSAVMTAIVLSGRTGAAFAAQIGAMQGNEEVDALSTLGVSPIEFLVLPRMLALMLMTPLLCIYANLMGIAGGFIVATATLNVSPTAYLLRTQEAVDLTDFAVGLTKGVVFGWLVAVTGCLCGIQSGRSAFAVGAAATSAVVSGILAIIVADALFAVLLHVLGL